MATIEQDLAQIRQAVYGEEVREAIADGIEQCYQDSTANAQIERIIAKGQETYDSIPADYSGLSDEISDLKSVISATDNLLSDGTDLFAGSLTDRTATSSGVTYTMTGNNIAVSGTISGLTVFNMYSSSTPNWMQGGKTYIVRVTNNTILEVEFQAKTEIQTSLYTFARFTGSGQFAVTVPDGINTLRVRLLSDDSGSVVNGNIIVDITEAVIESFIEDIDNIKMNYCELSTDNCSSIPDGTNFNNYKTPGTYKVTNNTHAGTMVNIPLKMSGKLIVLSLSQTARLYQIYATTVSAASIYIRYFNGTSWADWKRVNYMKLGYVQYSSGSFDNGKATEALNVYQPASSGFIKYVLYHYIDTNQAENYDVWRIYHAYHVDDLSDSNLLDISISGEWECALHLNGRDDFSGGSTHGDEIMQGSIVALRNGKPVNITSLTELTAFYEFTLIRTSKLYDPANHSTVIADHGVKYKFDTSCLTIDQSVIWRVAETLTNCFLCMFLPSKNVIDRAVSNSDFKTLTLPSSTSTALTTITKSNATAVTMWDTGTGVSAEISTPVYPTGLTGGDQISISDNGGNNYNKLYFKVCGGGTSANGEMWKSTSVYKLDYAS